MTPTAPLADWSTFASAMVSASATLTGLIFLGVSINLRQVLDAPGRAERAAESLLQLFQAFFLAASMLVPGLSLRVFGAVCLGLGVVSWVAQCRVLWKTRALYRSLQRSAMIGRAILVHSSTLPFGIAGVALLLGHPTAVYAVLPGFFFSFVGGLIGAWVMLVEILR